MKVRSIRHIDGVNPAYDTNPNPAIVTLPDGTSPTREMPELLPWPIGTVIEHPHAGVLCCYGYANSPPVAEPLDEEAKAFAAADMAERPERIEELHRQYKAADPDTPLGRYLRMLAISYGLIEEDSE
jgi:hypothetical protein